MNGKTDPLNDVIAAEAAERLLAEREDARDGNLLSWLKRSPVHVGEYLGMARLSMDIAHAAERIEIPLDALVADARADETVVALIAGDLRAGTRVPVQSQWPKFAAAAFGLAISLALLAGIGWILDGHPSSSVEQYTTSHGEERTVRLADGTFVHLNTDSAIAVNFGTAARLVELERGEAYFEVAKQTAHPFRVRAGASILQDIGTSFDVFRESGGTIVTVVEGRVGAFAAAGARSAQHLADLHAGEQAMFSPAGAIESRTVPDLNQTLAWTRQEIVFDRQPIAEVAAEFNRYNDVPIDVPDARIATIPISGTFSVRAEKSFVAFLQNLSGVKVEERAGAIVVTAKANKARRKEAGSLVP